MAMTKDQAVLIAGIPTETAQALIEMAKDAQRICIDALVSISNSHDLDMFYKGGYWAWEDIANLKITANNALKQKEEHNETR